MYHSKLKACLIGTTFLLLVLFPNMAEACPNCKGNLDANHQAFGFAISILFMMGMPFAILTGWCVTLWKLTRKRG